MAFQKHKQRPGDAAVGSFLRYEAARLKLSHAITVCRRAGLKVVVDADAVAIRLIPEADYRRGAADIRKLGETISVDKGDV